MASLPIRRSCGREIDIARNDKGAGAAPVPPRAQEPGFYVFIGQGPVQVYLAGPFTLVTVSALLALTLCVPRAL